jgi:hypothetical protein
MFYDIYIKCVLNIIKEMSTYMQCSQYNYFPTITFDNRTFEKPKNFNTNSNLVEFIMGQQSVLDDKDVQRMVTDLGTCGSPHVADYVNWRLQHSEPAFYRRDLATANIINNTCNLGLSLPPNPPPVGLINQLIIPKSLWDQGYG